MKPYYCEQAVYSRLVQVLLWLYLQPIDSGRRKLRDFHVLLLELWAQWDDSIYGRPHHI
jgi:hypothetical protein